MTKLSSLAKKPFKILPIYDLIFFFAIFIWKMWRVKIQSVLRFEKESIPVRRTRTNFVLLLLSSVLELSWVVKTRQRGRQKDGKMFENVFYSTFIQTFLTHNDKIHTMDTLNRPILIKILPDSLFTRSNFKFHFSAYHLFFALNNTNRQTDLKAFILYSLKSKTCISEWRWNISIWIKILKWQNRINTNVVNFWR